LFRPYTSAGSVITILDPTEHRERRAIWNRVFSSSALKAYEPLLQVRVAQLGTALAARAGQPLDLAEWLGFLALDFMGSFSFSGAFDFLARGEDSAGFHALLMKSLASWEALGTIPWCRALVLSLPKTGTNSYRDFARRMIRNRVQNGSQHRDVFYYLVRHEMVIINGYCCSSLPAAERGRGRRPSAAERGHPRKRGLNGHRRRLRLHVYSACERHSVPHGTPRLLRASPGGARRGGR
jgi:hypothetical protein